MKLPYIFIFIILPLVVNAQSKNNYKTYCNPIDIDYTYMSHYRAERDVSYRSGADPAIVNFKGKYYLFVTRSHGYWVSDDMSNWQFIRPQAWYFNGSNAPAAAVYNDKIIVLGDPSGRGAVIETANPEIGDWKTNFAVINPGNGIQDPNLFVDDDGRVYLYEESSNAFPIRGVELDPENYYVPVGEQQDLIYLNPEKNGWERFGQDHKSDLKPFIEGPWMMKHNGKYYLEYGAPGTQWNVYADGVYLADSPLGPFTYAPYNPVSYKPGGFLKGSGHGSTVRDNHGNYWHYATMAISVNFKFERRIGMYPAGFEDNGQMYVNTAYGDYPHYLPDVKQDSHKNRFTGWQLLSYKKPVRTNSAAVNLEYHVVDESDQGYMQEQIKGYGIEHINDEEIRSYWVSDRNDDTVWVEIDLEQPSDIYAIQVNFQDFRSKVFGKPDGLTQQYRIAVSSDRKKWKTIVDKSQNKQDEPHDYVELSQPVIARYIRYENIKVTNEFLSIADFRIFGLGNGEKPKTPAGVKVIRQEDRRNTDISWKKVKDATGYVIYWGISPEHLNLSAMMYDTDHYELRALTADQQYFYRIEAFNENGISSPGPVFSTP